MITDGQGPNVGVEDEHRAGVVGPRTGRHGDALVAQLAEQLAMRRSALEPGLMTGIKPRHLIRHIAASRAAETEKAS